MASAESRPLTPPDGRRGTRLADGLHSAFPTPLLVKRYGDSDLNRQLVDYVTAWEAREPSLGMSNVGGWHSPGNFLEGAEPAVVELRRRVSACLRKMLHMTSHKPPVGDQTLRITAWANVARSGAYNAIHNHTPALYSGVYYAAVGDAPPEGGRDGLIEFVDPRPGPHGGPLPTHTFNAPLIVDPEPGMMLVFPGWLLHYVHPYRGTTPRVSIAFNLRLASPPEPEA